MDQNNKQKVILDYRSGWSQLLDKHARTETLKKRAENIDLEFSPEMRDVTLTRKFEELKLRKTEECNIN